MRDPAYNAQQPASGFSLRDLLHVYFKHQVKILLIFITTVVTVFAGTLLTDPVYEATASLLVKNGREYQTKPVVGDSRSLMVVDQEAIVNSEIQILYNRKVIERVVTDMGVGTIYPKLISARLSGITPVEAATLQFSKALYAVGIKNSNVISVSYQNQDPVIAAKALTLLIEFFKEKHLEVFSNPQSSFLEKQLADYQQRLKASETALETFKQQSQVYSVEEQRSLLLKQRVDLDTALNGTKNRVEEIQKRIATYREQLQHISQDPARYMPTDMDKVVGDAQTQLLSLQLKEQELRAKDYRSDSRAVGSVRTQLLLVKRFLKAQQQIMDTKARTANPVYQDVEKEMLKAEAELISQRASAVTPSPNNLTRSAARYNLSTKSRANFVISSENLRPTRRTT